ncbi:MULTISPECIES: hypothetical protein [Dyella]|uniref:Uncharacterized protein n=2 Tax=Dyella TaxID=231454 RepID=A0A4R0Z008_9GAMM|nr:MULTISPECIES: hypothetical protein [Dyella]TBR39353.1 hypothetical protein EYV96_03780 [Dyella terrae]TCI13059.1 hypothetical protein EZM97_07085 [Dyella soli]
MAETFYGWFIWGLILAAPVWWLVWRFRVVYWIPRMRSLMRHRAVQLPAQVEPLVILGKRQQGNKG